MESTNTERETGTDEIEDETVEQMLCHLDS